MDRWLDGILSTKVAATSCLRKFKVNMACIKEIMCLWWMEEIFEIRSYKTDKLSGCSRMYERGPRGL